MSSPFPSLDNVVQLLEGVPKRLHFVSGRFGDRELVDPLDGQRKMVTTLQLLVDEEDGVPVAKSLGITSDNFAGQLAAYLPSGIIGAYDFTITRRGTGFATRYSVQATPRG